jgi:NAD-dependent SIR2 family protein deacetylase
MDKSRCPKCGSAKTVWRGYRYNEKSKKRLRLCKSCGSKFTPDPVYWRMRFSPDEIREALMLRRKGFSTTEAQQHLARKGVRVSRWTIILWERRFKEK